MHSSDWKLLNSIWDTLLHIIRLKCFTITCKLVLCHYVMHWCHMCVYFVSWWTITDFFWKAENLSPWSFLDKLFRKMQEPLSNRQMSWWLDDHVLYLCKQHSQRGFTIYQYFITNHFFILQKMHYEIIWHR